MMNISRRGFLYAAAAIPLLKGQESAPACTLAAEQEEGPYYVDGAKLRRDITEGKHGMPLTLRVALLDAKSCAPLPYAAVDIWHCDPLGVYSGYVEESRKQFGRGPMPPPPGGMESFSPGMPPPPRMGGRGPRKIDETRFLRGVQISNKDGMVEFTTLYPGWYQGRAIHIHLKTHASGERASDKYAGGHISHTGQLFFPEEINRQIAEMQPYAKHSNVERLTQDKDYIFTSQHGSGSIVRMEKIGKGSTPDGFVASVTLAIDPDRTPPPVGPPPFPGNERPK